MLTTPQAYVQARNHHNNQTLKEVTMHNSRSSSRISFSAKPQASMGACSRSSRDSFLPVFWTTSALIHPQNFRQGSSGKHEKER